MADLRGRLRRLRGTQIGGLASDSLYVAIWQGSTAIADLVQISLIVHLLGLAEYGRFTLVIALVTLVGGFFSMRVGLAATSFGAEALTEDPPRAAGIFQLALLVDFATAATACALLAGLAPFVGSDITGGAPPELIAIGALSLVAQSADTTSIVILRLHDRFRLVAIYSALVEGARIVMVVVGLVVFESLAAVLVAVVLGKLGRGVVSIAMALRISRSADPPVPVWQRNLRRIPRDVRWELLKMMGHTNIVGYGRLAQLQLPTLLLGGLVGATQTGVYKLGLAAATFIGRLADPASAALLPRFAKLWAARQLADVRVLIRHTALIFVPTTLAALTVLIVLREPVLRALGAGDRTAAAATILVIGGFAQALYGAFFWNRVLLYAARRAAAVSLAVCTGAALQIAVLLVTVPSHGVKGAAIGLLAGELLVYSGSTWYALRVLRQEESRTAALA